MKELFILLFTINCIILQGQTIPTTILKEGNYTVTGNVSLTASQSIILKPNTHIKFGSSFVARVVEDAYLPISLSNENYVLTRSFQSPTKTGVVVSNKDVIESVIYYDGLGRAKQNIAIKQSPSKKDIVTHIAYDGLGRKAKDFLPYVSSKNNGSINSNSRVATQSYYQQKYPEDFTGVRTLQEVNAYSEKHFDNSPLNRVIRQGAPGKDWDINIRNILTGGANHFIGFDYQTNEKEEVKRYSVELNEVSNVYTPKLIEKEYYQQQQLYKTIVKDENHDGSATKLHTTEEFKNKQGQVVLKRTYITNTQTADTYYVYDDYGNLTYVLPPKTEASIDKPNEVELAELCYQYKYDYRNRLVEKKIPGKGWEYIIYDKLDRPVMTQDVNQRTKNKWLFTKYDVFGRVVMTGLYTYTGRDTPNQAEMQNYFNVENNTSSKQYISKVTTGTGYYGTYYNNTTFPNRNITVYTVNYYDNYNFNRAGTATSVSNVYGKNSTSRLKGLATGSRVKVLGENNKWITTVTYYDDKARPIYVYTKNDYLLSTDIVKSKLDFVGKVEETTSIHTKTDDNLPSITIKDKFSMTIQAG